MDHTCRPTRPFSIALDAFTGKERVSIRKSRGCSDKVGAWRSLSVSDVQAVVSRVLGDSLLNSLVEDDLLELRKEQRAAQVVLYSCRKTLAVSRKGVVPQVQRNLVLNICR